MRFARPLIPGILHRRYNRFLSEIDLDGGERVTAHCPNPGAMLGLCDPGLKVWVEPNDDPKRKLRHGWRLAEPGGAWAGIDTSVPNKVAGEALKARAIPAFADYAEIRAEVRYGTRSRVDFLATGEGLPDCYIEVKNVHLMREPGLAEFPDSVTSRGAKHLDELSAMVAAGHRAAMLYVVQYTGLTRLSIARDIDPAYGAAFDRAREAGVEMHVWGCCISPEEIVLDRPLAMAE